jgi:RNA recognition motif-containing protein
MRLLCLSLLTSEKGGRPRGYAFITMDTLENAEEAVRRANGMAVNSREIRVSAYNHNREICTKQSVVLYQKAGEMHAT